MKKYKKITYFISAAFICAILFFTLVYTKKICINDCFAKRYPLKGIDVSHYQGKIQWKQLENQDIDFAYIKATEGSSHIDSRFHENWKAAEETKLLTGAYHFFSFDSPAQTQADLYIKTVGNLSGKLIPAIDVEYYGNKEKNPPSKKDVVRELKVLLEILENHYNTKPVIYTTYKVYHRYIKNEFTEYPLWIRNVYYPPSFDIGKKWTFWQYRDTAVLKGYKGKEPYIDLNVFWGSKEDLKKYLIPSILERTN